MCWTFTIQFILLLYSPDGATVLKYVVTLSATILLFSHLVASRRRVSLFYTTRAMSLVLAA